MRIEALVDFVRPGLAITINSAQITSAGAISVTYTLTDPIGLPLDAAGATTPGAVSLTYVAVLHPQGPGAICGLHDRDRRPARRWAQSPARILKLARARPHWSARANINTLSQPGPGGI